METSVSPLQITNITLQGAVMALCLELTIRSLFLPASQKSWLVRSLKITMAVTMMIKSGIFTAFNSKSLQGYCELSGRISDSFFHISTLAGIAILLQRVAVIVPIQHRQSIIVFHAIILLLRFGVALTDIVLVHIWADTSISICRYKDKHEIGISYTLFDSAVDVYVSFMVTFILCMHIRRLNKAHLLGGNLNLYISVVLTNVVRTVILSILSIICTVYYISKNEDPTTVMVFWPINNLFFIILIGYDTNIAKSIRKLRSLVVRDLHKKKFEPPTRGSHPHQRDRYSISLPDIEQQFNNTINEPLTPASARPTRSNSRLRRQSTITALGVNEDQVLTSKTQSGVSNNSTLECAADNRPNRTRHSSC